MINNYLIILFFLLSSIQISSCSNNDDNYSYSQYFLFNRLSYSKPTTDFFILEFNKKTGANRKVCSVKSPYSNVTSEVMFNDVFTYHDIEDKSYTQNYTMFYNYIKNSIYIINIDKNKIIYSIARINRGFLIKNRLIYINIYNKEIVDMNLFSNIKTILFKNRCISAFAVTEESVFVFCNGKIIDINHSEKDLNMKYERLVTEAGYLTDDWIWFSERAHEKTSNGHLHAMNIRTGASSLLGTDNYHAIFLKEIDAKYINLLCLTDNE